MGAEFDRLIGGLDTVQAAYYLRPHLEAEFRFEPLMVSKERLRADKNRKGELLQIGSESFLLQAYGSKSGYPLVLDNLDCTIECGEFNNPSFFVTYRSKALWQLSWAESVGLLVVHPEKLSRVDFAFDYQLAAPNFDSDSIVSLSTKDAQYRGDRKVQTIHYGKGDVVLRKQTGLWGPGGRDTRGVETGTRVRHAKLFFADEPVSSSRNTDAVGARVHTEIATGNRGEAAIPEPNRIIVDRERPRHAIFWIPPWQCASPCICNVGPRRQTDA
jgi:hypothetical protein